MKDVGYRKQTIQTGEKLMESPEESEKQSKDDSWNPGKESDGSTLEQV